MPVTRLKSIAVRVAFILSASADTFAASPAPVKAENGMVVTAQHLASEVGVEVLKNGGNAVDAAVAVGYALAVVYPSAGNIGGGGFMTIRLKDGTTTFLDFRETGAAGGDQDHVSRRQRRGRARARASTAISPSACRARSWASKCARAIRHACRARN